MTRIMGILAGERRHGCWIAGISAAQLWMFGTKSSSISYVEGLSSRYSASLGGKVVVLSVSLISGLSLALIFVPSMHMLCLAVAYMSCDEALPCNASHC